MKSNVGNIDKVVRILVALIISGLYFTDKISGVLGIVLLIVAGVFVITSFLGFCPIYWTLGLSSKPKEKKD